MPKSEPVVGEKDAAVNSYQEENFPPAGPDGKDHLFRIIVLPSRKPIAWGSSLDDPHIVEVCLRLKNEGVAYSLQPILFPGDLQTAENISDAARRQSGDDDLGPVIGGSGTCSANS